jgi:hypothetical protein
MTTFSQLIDGMAKELLRPDLRTAMASYLNQTVREIHFRPNINVGIRYDANRQEDELQVTTDDMWLWDLPSPTRFQDVEALYSVERGIYIPQRSPQLSRKFSFDYDHDLYWYRGGSRIAISGVKSGWRIQASYFLFPRALAYQPEATRVVEWDANTDTYRLKGGGTPTQEQLNAATNWVLMRWQEALSEGIRAKVWKRLGDETRARMAFSAYESLRSSIWQSEPSSGDVA